MTRSQLTLVGTAIALVVACAFLWPASARTTETQVRRLGVTGDLVWPAPPDRARIRFVQTLDPAGMQSRPSWLTRIFRAVVGRSDPPRMTRPYGIAVAPGGTVYVADTGASVIHVFDLEKPRHSMIRLEAGSLVGIAFADGRLFVTDSTAGRLLCLDQKGRTIWSLGRDDGFERPTGLTMSGDRVYVVDTLASRVVMVSLDGQLMGAFGVRGSGPGEFNFPTNIARGPDGRIYVTDTLNFRVQIFDADGSFVKAFGRLGDGSGDFDKPKGIAVDSAGHVYVVEGLNDVVQVFDADGRLLLVFGGSGREDGQFWLPSGITVANDVIYVADSANERLQVFQYLKGAE